MAKIHNSTAKILNSTAKIKHSTARIHKCMAKILNIITLSAHQLLIFQYIRCDLKMPTLKELIEIVFPEDEDDVDDDISNDSSLDEIELRLKKFRKGYRIMYEGPKMMTGACHGFVDEVARKNASRGLKEDLKELRVSKDATSKEITEDYERAVKKYQSSFSCDILDFSDKENKKEKVDYSEDVISVSESLESLDLRLSSDDEKELLNQNGLLSSERRLVERNKSVTINTIHRSCLKKAKDSNVKNESRRVFISDKISVFPFNPEEKVIASNSYSFDEEFRSNKLPNLTLDEQEPSRKHKSKDNLIKLPHRNASVRLPKRIDPSQYEVESLEEEVVENYVSLIQDVEQKKHLRISKWLICDGLLERLNSCAFQNLVVSRVEFPRMPSCLIDKAMNSKMNMFPKEFCQIFVSIGFDIIVYYHDEETKAHLRFIAQLCGWLAENINGKRIDYDKDIYFDGEWVDQLASFFYRAVSVVVITIPEVGEFSGDFADFNRKLKEQVRKIKNSGIPIVVKILDWAELVRNSKDKIAMGTVEGRIALLIKEMCLEYGLLLSD